MAVDIGCEAIGRVGSMPAGYTALNKTKPAEASGIVKSIDIWANEDITGLRVGTFYTTDGNMLRCRASQAIAGTITAGSKVTKAVSIAVEIGDYIGFYCDSGGVEQDFSGYDDVWRYYGEAIDPDDQATYTLLSGDALSLGGYIGPAGWTGKISGVTNPAKIMGVDVANIAKVKGVESA